MCNILKVSRYIHTELYIETSINIIVRLSREAHDPITSSKRYIALANTSDYVTPGRCLAGSPGGEAILRGVPSSEKVFPGLRQEHCEAVLHPFELQWPRAGDCSCAVLKLDWRAHSHAENARPHRRRSAARESSHSLFASPSTCWPLRFKLKNHQAPLGLVPCVARRPREA